MKSTRKKLFPLIISVIAVFVIVIGFSPNGSDRALSRIKSGAVYVSADEKIKKITVIPTNTEKITEEDISKSLKKNVELPDSESVKNGAEITVNKEKYLLIIKGDAVSDGKITAGDARAVLRITAKLDNASDAVRDASDINSDGNITASEARDVLRFAAKLSDRLFNSAENKTDFSEKASETVKDEITSFPISSKPTEKTASESSTKKQQSTAAEKTTVKLSDVTAETTTLKTSEPTAEVTTEKQPEMTSEITTKKHPGTKTENTTAKQPETSTASTTVKKPEPTAEITTEKRTEKTTEITTKRQTDTTSETQITTESTSKNDYEDVSRPSEEESSLPEKENKNIVWVAIGDSKTDFNNNGVSRPDNYPYWIAKRNPGLRLINMGSAGGMITNERVNKAGDTKILYPSMYKKATEINVKPDIITVAGGFNDWNWCVPLGEFTTDISSYDTSAGAYVSSTGAVFPLKNTFYAGVFRLAEYLKTEYPDIPILWITPCPTAVRDGGGANGHDVNQPLSAYVQAIKDVCGYFSIPVCDMSAETTVPYYTPEDLKNYWRNSDGIHPNGKASEIYSFKIEEYMKKVYESYGYEWNNE